MSTKMITIEVNNSYSKVIGLNADQFQVLRSVLSYETNAGTQFYTGGRVFKRYLLSAKGEFPTGLLKTVVQSMNREKLPYKTKDLRKRPTKAATLTLNLGGTVPRDFQRKAVVEALKANRGGIVAPTGSGKSLIISLLIAELKVRTLIVVPSRGIRDQLSRDIQAKFGPNKSIRVENIDSPALKNMKDFDCLIIDEVHHAAAKTYQKLNKLVWGGIYYRFFFSATYFRNQENESLLFEGIAGQPVFNISYDQAVKSGAIVPVEALYVKLPKIVTNGYSWSEVYKELVTGNEERNNIISYIASDLVGAGKSTLILVKEINHGAALEASTGIPFANGQDDMTKRHILDFNSGKIKGLIATYGVMGEGIDSKPAEYVIIAGLGKARSAFMQQVGRGVRTYPGKDTAKVIIFKDTSHKWTRSHFNTEKKILIDEYGASLVELTL